MIQDFKNTLSEKGEKASKINKATKAFIKQQIHEINILLKETGISTKCLYQNNPACEEYIDTTFKFDDGFCIETMVPYVYRRSGLYLDTVQDIANHLKGLKDYFTKTYINSWCLKQQAALSSDDSIYAVFFRILLGSFCKEITQDKFPQNNNPQKIIQKIKDTGFVVSVMRGKQSENGGLTRYWLLHIPQTIGTIYETMSEEFKSYVVEILGSVDVYEGKKGVGLLPDHKFSEIRWDENTPEENSVEMSAEKVRAKFQMLTTQRNQ